MPVTYDNQNEGVEAQVRMKGCRKCFTIPVPIKKEQIVPKFEYFWDDSERLLVNFFCPKKAVPDVCRGTITVTKDTIKYQENNRNKKTLQTSYYNDTALIGKAACNLESPIVILTESPHKYEYLYCDVCRNLMPKGPAQGSTGRHITSTRFRHPDQVKIAT